MLCEFTELLVSDVFIGVPSVHEYQGRCSAPPRNKLEEKKEKRFNVQCVPIVILAFRMLLPFIFLSFSNEVKRYFWLH
jgi:hypothetical protein